ncbi:MAG: ATP-binding protein [Pseudomonadota bacterium]
MTAFGAFTRAAVAVFAFVAMVAAIFAGSNYTTRFYLADIADRGQSTLRLSVAGLDGVLSRFDYLPGLIAKDPSMGRALMESGQEGIVRKANADLRTTAEEAGVTHLFLMDRKGLVVAASNSGDPDSLVGRSLGYKPFFMQALEGSTGRYFALDPRSGSRGYYFAAPVRSGETIAGVVAARVDLDPIESAWTSPVDEILVLDRNGIVFMASRPDWLFRSLEPLTDTTRKAIAGTRQFAGREVGTLDAETFVRGGIPLIAIEDGRKVTEFLIQEMAIPETDMTVSVLSRTDAAQTQAFIFTIIASLLTLIAVMFLVFLWQRRARLLERLTLQREAHDVLERRVAARTASLNEANSRLISEIAERRATEAELRKTQEDLIQAGKLAALGQMSTALSHEFNQPLAAIRSYADNADILLERERYQEARDNVGRISSLTDRMAEISKHLRTFARKPDEKTEAVSTQAVIRDTLDLMHSKISAAGVEIVVQAAETDVCVQAGHVRLQQVLVNLVSNAIDAMRDSADPVVTIGVARAVEAGHVTISVRDRGPGVAEDAAAQVFDPFFTTKGVGEGLGLGLSISYNIVKDFGGTLRACNHAEGGAEFTVTLKEAPPAGSTQEDDDLQSAARIAAE